MNSRPNIHLAWCSYRVAKYAVQRWHYSKTMPAGKTVRIGVWEDSRFVGAVIFGAGSGNMTNGEQYGLAKTHRMAELCRVALASRRTPTTRIISIAIKMLRSNSPKLRMIISFADPRQGHIGTIYQAGGWVYTGTSAVDYEYYVQGRWRHHRSATSRQSVKGVKSRPLPGKYRYLMPLDTQIADAVQTLSRPYPKRPKDSSEPSANLAEEGGAAPTRTLQ